MIIRPGQVTSLAALQTPILGGEGEVASYAAFLDYGFLRNQGAKMLGVKTADINVNPGYILSWRQWHDRKLFNAPFVQFLRLYWYDGQWDPSENPDGYRKQRPALDSIAEIPGIQLRLGQLARRPPGEEGLIRRALTETAKGMSFDAASLVAEFEKHYDLKGMPAQKGVDTLLALDFVRLAQQRIYDVAILIAGDRDFGEAVRIAQNEGRRVALGVFPDAAIATELLHVVDSVLSIDRMELMKMLGVSKGEAGNGS
jgi:uncharacterized LabA/DUF88 family protein